MARLRKRIPTALAYSPMWEGPVEGYTVNFMKSNFWRVKAHMEYQDAMQEAKLVFVKLKRKYGRLSSPQHFMSLYKTTLKREFDELSTRDTKFRNEVNASQINSSENSEFTEVYYNQAGDLMNDGMLAIMIEQAPAEIKKVLKLFLETPVEFLDHLSSVWKKKGKYNDFGNKHINEVLGMEEGTDVEKLLREYFQ